MNQGMDRVLEDGAKSDERPAAHGQRGQGAQYVIQADLRAGTVVVFWPPVQDRIQAKPEAGARTKSKARTGARARPKARPSRAGAGRTASAPVSRRHPTP